MKRRIAIKIIRSCTSTCLAWKRSTLEEIRRKWYPWDVSPLGHDPWQDFFDLAKRGGDTVRGRKNYAKET